MSSRRLFALIKHLPDDSAFKTAARDGDWKPEIQLAAAMVNAAMGIRSDLYAILDKSSFKFKPILSPSVERAQAEKRAAIRAGHDDVIAQLRGTKPS
jgi:hypothetical protein